MRAKCAEILVRRGRPFANEFFDAEQEDQK